MIYVHISYKFRRQLPRQAHCLKTKVGRNMSATRHHYQGKQCLDIHLLKPAIVWAEVATAAALGNQQVLGANGPAQEPPGEWVNCAYRTAHPQAILRWRPSKLAEWIGDNYWAALSIPMRLGGRLASLTPTQGNSLREHPCSWHKGSVGHLRTFGAIQCHESVGEPAFQWQFRQMVCLEDDKLRR